MLSAVLAKAAWWDRRTESQHAFRPRVWEFLGGYGWSAPLEEESAWVVSA